MKQEFKNNKKVPDEKKIRGEYYTPHQLADYIVQWALSKDIKKVLEPSCGNGNFIESILKWNILAKKTIELTAVEINESEISKAQQRFLSSENKQCIIRWINDDFFEFYSSVSDDQKFDVVIGNPPFIRFQYFDEVSRDKAFISLRKVGYKPTKLANSWNAFVQLSIELLKEDGHLAMVLPAELLQVKYSGELRSKLAYHFHSISVISFKKLVFNSIQQETILLLAEKKSAQKIKKTNIYAVELENENELKKLDLSKSCSQLSINVPAIFETKWTYFFLNPSYYEALQLARVSPSLKKMKDFASVDVGVVTGRNSFFLLSEEQVSFLKARDFVLPIIGKTSALKSIKFDLEDFAEYKKTNYSYLLNLKSKEKLPIEILNYIQLGKEKEINKGYKCSIRSKWYEVPSVYVPDAFMFRQIYLYPLIVDNRSSATSTDTIHRVRFKVNVNQSVFCAAAFNSLTLAYAEILGRSYGGGVLELEPSEAEELPVFYHDDLIIDPEKVSTLLKKGKYLEALDYVDSIILESSLGLEKSSINKIRSAWIQLRDRRKYRC